MEKFSITKVVSRDVVTDIIQQLRNVIGFNLRGYENRINETVNRMLEELDEKYEVDWFRIQTDQLANAAIMITIFGEGELKE